MGEYEQPVLGMRSCADLSELDDKGWRAREWFVVRKAEVQLSEDSVLIPFVRMGVEAREQVITPEGLRDAPVTSPAHPMARYAQTFTRNFDLIAERRSVIYHLREVAKASVLAKFLLENKVDLDEAWFYLGAPARQDCVLEIPQLWNERTRASIQVQHGTIVGAEQGVAPKMHGVYGGVEMGLEKFDKFSLSRSNMAASFNKLLRQDGGGRVVGPLLSSAQNPQGVDFCLDRFELSGVRRVTPEKKLGSWSGDLQSADSCAAMGLAFWQIIDGGSKHLFGEEDKKLLKEVFNPNLSDRREEGDLFVPPDTSIAYITRLRNLVKEEQEVRRRRREHFLSDAFWKSDPDPLFPHSWAAGFEIARRRGEERVLAGPPSAGLLHPRPDYMTQAVLFDRLLKSGAPVLDRSTEDGLRFRIYRVGSLEVRTTQEPGSDEAVGAVFSTRPPPQRLRSAAPALGGSDKFIKVTEYVERVGSVAPPLGQVLAAKPLASPAHRRSYVVLETKQGDMVVTEQLPDGTLMWDENPEDLEDRNSLAKAVRSSACGITVQGMRRYQLREAKRFCASSSECKRYAQGAFAWASGAGPEKRSGFGRPAGHCRWQLLSVASGAAPRAGQVP